ncbi:MAG TPA: carbohydrate kinase family protein [Candidatus Paceibacterota bacterium]|nr:carbohydrate kinase family protein [Candidatus Paceibacterota bacterium]
MDQIDFFAIGDIVTEPFIRLKDANVHCKINNEECEICMRWGDKIPYESFTVCAAVGNSSNAAVAAARLGLNAGLRAYLGHDRYGEDSLGVLKAEHVDTSYIVVDPTRPSNYHYVLWYADNRTILVKHEEYDYTVPELPVAPKWIYLSSLAANSLPYHQAMFEWLKKYPESKLAFQPGTFQMKLGIEALKPIYERSDLFICNKEEAERILGKPAGSDMKELLVAVQALGPKIVVITDDKRGCYAIDEAGKTIHVPRYPDPRPPFEVTGAGDALASGTAAALALKKPLDEALRWGSANASAVLQEIGAQKGLLTREQVEEAVAHPPAEWNIESL